MIYIDSRERRQHKSFSNYIILTSCSCSLMFYDILLPDLLGTFLENPFFVVIFKVSCSLKYQKHHFLSNKKKLKTTFFPFRPTDDVLQIHDTLKIKIPEDYFKKQCVFVVLNIAKKTFCLLFIVEAIKSLFLMFSISKERNFLNKSWIFLEVFSKFELFQSLSFTIFCAQNC